MKTTYKNYRLGPHTFTVKFTERKHCINFKIMKWHLAPLTKMESLVEFFTIPTYARDKWNKANTWATLEEKVIEVAADFFNF